MSVKQRGFGSKSPDHCRAMGAKGGKAAWSKGTAHRFTSAQAAAAGKIGRKGFAKRPSETPPLPGTSVPGEAIAGTQDPDMPVSAGAPEGEL